MCKIGKILNMKDYGGRCPPHAVRVDRATAWGNPFHIGKDGNRAEVIARFRKKMIEDFNSGKLGIEDFAELHGKDLACWCSPAPCHAEVLREFAARAHKRLNG